MFVVAELCHLCAWCASAQQTLTLSYHTRPHNKLVCACHVLHFPQTSKFTPYINVRYVIFTAETHHDAFFIQSKSTIVLMPHESFNKDPHNVERATGQQAQRRVRSFTSATRTAVQDTCISRIKFLTPGVGMWE